MTIWLLALLLTAIACAALYYAGAGRVVNAGPSPSEAAAEHLRAQLRAIDTDAANGRIGDAEATAARAEIAREAIRLKQAQDGAAGAGRGFAAWLPVLAVAIVATGTYAYLGRPDLPAEPLAARADVAAASDLEGAIETIEARLVEDPTDLRGWQVIAPAYMQLGRYADAAEALRRVNELTTPTADTLTDLGEALMMQQGGVVDGEAYDLFKQAAALDAAHVRSRYYIANEDTRRGDYTAAIEQWNELLALAQGDEPWVVTARNGLAFAEQELAGGGPEAVTPPDPAEIDAMVDGLASRLEAEGGTIGEWTQLVRSRIVQGRTEDAQAAYDAARRAYPEAADRVDLDGFALGNGLVAQ